MSDIFANLRFKKLEGFDSKKLADAVIRGYEAQKREKRLWRKETFSPSSLAYGSGRCPRRWVLSFQGKYEGEETATGLNVAVMNQGSGAHSRVQTALAESGVLQEEEKEITCQDPPIRGFIDAIVDIDDAEGIPVEIKTTRMEAFNYRAVNMTGTAYHMYQLLTYMKLLGKKFGAFIYENKNDNTLLVVPVEMNEVNQRVIDAAFDWMRLVYKAYKDGKTPVQPWKQSSPNCAGCPLFDACWNVAPEGDIKIKPMVVHKW